MKRKTDSERGGGVLDPRILVAFLDIPSEEALRDTVLHAVGKAAWPLRLTFALPRRFQPQDEESPVAELMRELPQGDVRFFDEMSDLQAVQGALRGETHVLWLRGAHAFLEKWEKQLLARFDRCDAPDKLLTGTVSALCEPYEPECSLPALAEEFTEDGVLLGRGMPLVCSRAPVQTLLADTNLLLMEAGLLSRVRLPWDTLSFACYFCNIRVFALDQPLLCPCQTSRPSLLRREVAAGLPRGAWERFERRAGFSLENRTVSVRAKMGLFGVESDYPQQLPGPLQLRERALSILPRAAKPCPLLVSAFVDLPERKHPAQWYLTRFEYLARLQNAPLVLYAGGEKERSLKVRFPNTMSYPDHGVLPRQLLYEGMRPMQHFLRSKPLVLRRALGVYSAYSHAAWADMDLLSHPVCHEAVLSFSHLMDDKVHIARVDGEIDTSFFVAPRRLMKTLCDTVLSINQLDMDTHHPLDEQSLWRQLLERRGDLIVLHDMPRKGLLFLTGLDPELISKQEQAALLPPEEGNP